MEKKKEVKNGLSNEGLSSMFNKVEHFNIKMEVDDNTKKFTIKLEKRDATNRGYYDSDEEDWVVKPEYTSKDVTDYINKLIKVADKNKILDTDKVFFIKNSIYPRSNFNRYSDKARRIENIDKADKIVFNPDANFYMRGSRGYIHEETFLHGNSQHYTWRNLCYNSNSFITASINKNIHKELSLLSKHASNYNSELFDEEFLKLINKQEGKDFVSHHLNYLSSHTKMNRTFFDLLFENREISKFVTDNSVNRYIDQFKEPITDENFKLLCDSLGEGDKNITVGLKLLENMDIKKNLPYFYALFIIASKNSSNIVNNKVWNSIGIKNLRENYKVGDIINRDYYGGQHTLGMLEKVYTTNFKKEEDKRVFKTLCNDAILSCLKDILSEKVYNVLNLETK